MNEHIKNNNLKLIMQYKQGQIEAKNKLVEVLEISNPQIIKGIKILYSVDIEFQQDYIYRTLVRQLKEQIRPITDYAIKLTSESSTI